MTACAASIPHLRHHIKTARVAKAVDEVRQPHEALAALVPLLGVGPPARHPRALQPHQRVRVCALRRRWRRLGPVVALKLLRHQRAWHLAKRRTGIGRSIAKLKADSRVPWMRALSYYLPACMPGTGTTTSGI